MDWTSSTGVEYTYFPREPSEGSQLPMVKRTCETRLEIHKILAPSNAGCDIKQQDAKEDGLQKYHEECCAPGEVHSPGHDCVKGESSRL